jgi:hypothetical protein
MLYVVLYFQNFILQFVIISNFSALYISPFQIIVTVPFDEKTEHGYPITAAVTIEYGVNYGVLFLDVSFILIIWVTATFRRRSLSCNVNFGDLLSNANK